MKTNFPFIPVILLVVLISSCQKDATQSPAAVPPKNNLDITPHSAGTLSFSHPKKTICKGLIAWYPFLGNANDLSGNGNNGTLEGYTSPFGNPIVVGSPPTL